MPLLQSKWRLGFLKAVSLLQEQITGTQNNVNQPPHQAIAKTLPVGSQVCTGSCKDHAQPTVPVYACHSVICQNIEKGCVKKQDCKSIHKR